MTENSALGQLQIVLREGSYRHSALTVVHRWYAGYETDRKNLTYQGELVTDDYTMTRPAETGLPDVRGRQAYLDSFVTGYPGQTNAHHLRSLSVEHTGERTANVEVTHDFQTYGPSLNGAALLRYNLTLVQDPSERLPRISAFIEQVLEQHDGPFQSAYVENRVRAFVHYWLSLLEQPAENAEPLRELLAKDLEMNFSDGRILRTFDQVADWYAATVGQVQVSTHHVRDLKIDAGSDGCHRITMDFDWEAITVTGQPMIARTRHEWTLIETEERYLRLKYFEVVPLEPFTPVTAEQALAHYQAATEANI
jgi:hypothetical protein